MSIELSAEKLNTRERLLKAAAEIFSEQGMKGTTTREIARVAGVNETTLFRHFQTKELLFKAVVEQAANRIFEALNSSGMANHDLRKDLMYYARIYNSVLFENESMVRMFVAEAARQPEEAHQIACTAWLPVRQKLVDYLEQAKRDGQIRPELDCEQAFEALVSMLKGHMLRRNMVPSRFTVEEYLETAVDLFVRGIVAAQDRG